MVRHAAWLGTALALGLGGVAGAQPRQMQGSAANAGGPTREVVRFEGPIREDRLRTALQGATRRFETCWRRDAGSLRGRFELSLITAPDGRVVRARVLANELRIVRDGQRRAANGTTRCFERAGGRLRFPVSGGRTRPLLVRLSFDFGGAEEEAPAAPAADTPPVAEDPPPPPQRQRGPIRLPRHTD
jgi:hypothetical protein